MIHTTYVLDLLRWKPGFNDRTNTIVIEAVPAEGQRRAMYITIHIYAIQ